MERRASEVRGYLAFLSLYYFKFNTVEFLDSYWDKTSKLLTLTVFWEELVIRLELYSYASSFLRLHH